MNHSKPTPKAPLLTRLSRLAAAPFEGGVAGKLALLGVAGVGAALVGNGCSLVLNFDECTVDTDCDFAEGAYVCENGQCVSDGNADEADTGTDTTTGDGDTGTDTTTTTADTGTETTTETGTDTGMETGTDTVGEDCTTHTECVEAHNDNWLCGTSGQCINGLSAECQNVRWPDDMPQDDVVFVGSIMPTSPPFDTLVLPIQNSLRMAIDEFNDQAELPSGEKIAWVGCDSKGSPDLAKLAANHLLDVGVPAIVGPVFSGNVVEVAEEVTIPAGVFLITPTGTNKNITNIVDNDLVWRPIASDVYQANALADRLNAVASQTSTVMLYKDDSYGTDLLTDTFGKLDGAVANATKTYSYTVFPDMQDLVNEISGVLGPVVAQDQPETVVIVGTSEAALIILTYLQVASQVNPMPPIPTFVVSHGAVPAMVDAVKNAPDDATKGLLYMIMEGVAPIIFDEENFAAFNIRYKIKFNDQDAITTSSLSYDSLMTIAFAMSAIPEGEPITGANIAANIEKLVDKNANQVSFGDYPTFITTAVNAVSTGNSIDLKGVSGELDFDLATGDVRTDYLGWEAEPLNMDLSKPALAPQRIYVLNPEPAEDGNWVDLP